MKRALTAAALTAAALTLHAVDAVWTNTSTSVQVWTTAGNWTDSQSAAALETPPTQPADSVSFPFVDQRARVVDFCGDVNAADGSFSVASVSGPRFWTLRMPGWSYSHNNARRTFTCADVSGFSGSWQAAGPLQTIALTAETGVQTLETVSAANRLIIDVRSAAAEAKINVVNNAGAIEKKGAGGLTLGMMNHASQEVYLDNGALCISGAPEDMGALLSRAVVHLDANRPDTMKGYDGDDGRHYVTNWAHASGGDIGAELWVGSAGATPGQLRDPHAPFVNSNDVSTTGLPLMDFGAYVAANVDALGPTNCSLRFTKKLTGAREVFYVDMHSDPASTVNYLLCSDLNAESSIFSGNSGMAFKYYGNYPALAGGVVAFNGKENFPVMRDGRLQIPRPLDELSPTWDSLTATSVALDKGINLTHLCCDSLYADHCGGMRVAEVLVYTNVLTAAERRDINTYLMRKWFASYPEADVRTLHAAADESVRVSVPSGRVARVASLVLKGSSIVKTGGGTLEIGSIEPRDAAVTIMDGRVKMASTGGEVSSEEPANEPLFWYDADSADAFVKSGEDIKGWNDCRSEYASARKATSAANRSAGYPTNLTVSINGRTHTVVDYPQQGSATGAYMDFPYRKADSSVAKQKEAFVVIRFHSDTFARLYPIFGMYNINRNDRGWYNVLSPSNCEDDWGGVSATVNGVPLDPFGASDGADSIWSGDVWYVVSMAANTTGAGVVMRLGGDKNAGRCGGMTVGEYIGYDRALTPAERRDTVAYLMRKWLGTDHPDAEDRGLPNYVYPGDRPVVVTSDDDVSIRSCSGGDGSIVKDGAGKVTFDDVIDAYTDISVDSGELAFTQVGFVDKSYIHFDASDTSSFVSTYVDDSGATNVAKWADVRGAGATAGKYGGNSTQCFGTNPVVRVVETRPGQHRQVLDFLNARNRADSYTYMDCAAMLFDGAHRPQNVVEAYEIYADAHGCRNGMTFGDHNDNAFYRGVDGAWFRSWSGASVINGHLAIDGTTVGYDTVIGDGFHLLTVIPTAGVSVTGFGMSQENNLSGGFCIGELLVFTSAQTDVERSYLQQSLMHKWFGTAPAEWTNEVNSVSVAAGARLTLSENSALVVPTLSGSGAISAAAIAGVERLSLDTVGGLPACMTVEGKVSFADAVTVELADGLSRIPAGEYTLLTATGGVSGADAARWTIVSDAAARRSLAIVVDGSAVRLKVSPYGMCIEVR